MRVQVTLYVTVFFFSSRRRHTRLQGDWSSDVCSSDLRADVIRAWTPWAILTVFVFIWGLPSVKAALNGLFAPAFPMEGLHNLIEKVPPVVRQPTKEGAIYTLNLLSATGTGILLSAIVGGLVMKYNPVQ